MAQKVAEIKTTNNPVLNRLALACGTAVLLLSGPSVRAEEDMSRIRTIQNDTLRVTFQDADGTFSVHWLPGNREFVSGGRLYVGTETGGLRCLVGEECE